MTSIPDRGYDSRCSSPERRRVDSVEDLSDMELGPIDLAWPAALMGEIEEPPEQRLGITKPRTSKRPLQSCQGPCKTSQNPGSSKKAASGCAEGMHVPQKFEDVVKHRLKQLHTVLRSLSQAQMADVNSIGFGGLLEMYTKELPTDMFAWLADGFDPRSRQFYVNGTPAFVVSGWDAAGTFALNYSPRAVLVTEDETDREVQQLLKDWKDKYGIYTSGKITIDELEQKLYVLRAGGPDFKRIFVLYVLHSLLTPTASSQVWAGLLKSLMNVDGIKHLNWGGFIVDHMCECVQRYKDTGTDAGSEGCILLLMITYFQECPWQSIPKKMEVPLIGHWQDWKIGQRIKEEILGGGFGRGKYDNSWGWPILEATDHYPSPQSPVENITFVLDDDFHDDLELAVLFPEENDRAVATLIRDMNVVLFGHVDRNSHLGNLVKKASLSLGSMNSASPETLPACVKELINNLDVLLGALVPNEGVNTVELSSMEYLPTSYHSESSSPEEPWVHWPCNTGRVYVSRLVCRYASLKQFLPPSELEIADYCLGDATICNGREPLYHDGGCGWLLRRDLRTLEYGSQVSPVVITAWASIMNHAWAEYRAPKVSTSLVTVDKAEQVRDVAKLKAWIEGSQDQFSKAEMVFVPIKSRSHFYLLVINLKTNTLQCIDDVVHDEQEYWYRTTLTVASCVWGAVGKGGDQRGEIANKFTFERILPPWACRRYEYECGVSIMVAMETFNGFERDLNGIGYDIERVRLEKRVSYLARIVLNRRNIYRDGVLSEVNRFVLEKVTLLVQPPKVDTDFQ